MLLGQVNRTSALQLVARRAREVAEAQLVLVLLADEDQGQLTVAVVDGPAPELEGAVVSLTDTAFAPGHPHGHLRAPYAGGRGPAHRAARPGRGGRPVAGGFRPELRLDGPIDSAVPDEIRPDLLAVVREALDNTARHARASSARVTVEAAHRRLTVTVVDDGIGAAGTQPRGGLVNLRERAERHGGAFTLRPATATGTEVIWSVPI